MIFFPKELTMAFCKQESIIQQLETTEHSLTDLLWLKALLIHVVVVVLFDLKR